MLLLEKHDFFHLLNKTKFSQLTMHEKVLEPVKSLYKYTTKKMLSKKLKHEKMEKILPYKELTYLLCEHFRSEFSTYQWNLLVCGKL